MAIYDYSGNQIYSAYSKDGNELLNAYDVDGEQIWTKSGKIQFRVMSYNVQWFTKTNLYSDVLNEAFNTQNADIIGMQEYTLGTDNPTLIDGLPVRSYLYSKGYENLQVGTLIENKTAIASKLRTSAITEHVFSVQDNQKRSYLKCYINIGGKTIAFYNTHLDPYYRPQRALQMQEVIADASLEDMFVIVGDLNTGCRDTTSHEDYPNVIKPLIDAGYNVANCNPNRDGFIPTWTDKTDFEQSGWYATDNIITSSNINMVNVWADYYKVTHNPDQYDLDHVPIVADLEIVL